MLIFKQLLDEDKLMQHIENNKKTIFTLKGSYQGAKYWEGNKRKFTSIPLEMFCRECVLCNYV
jgi:hypothetical protein